MMTWHNFLTIYYQKTKDKNSRRSWQDFFDKFEITILVHVLHVYGMFSKAKALPKEKGKQVWINSGFSDG